MNFVSLSQCTGLEIWIPCDLEFKEIIFGIENNDICLQIINVCCGDVLSSTSRISWWML